MREVGQLYDAIGAGATSFRFSASKFELAELLEMARDASAAAARAGVAVDLWIDLPGTKTRLTSDEPLDLGSADSVRLLYDVEPSAGRREVRVSDSLFGRRVQVGDVVVWGDGEDAGRVVAATPQHCDVVPLTRGVVGPRKGIAVAGVPQPHVALTPDDETALSALSSSPFTGAIVSFVESSATVERARGLMVAGGGTAGAVIAKIETAAGVAAAREIARAADGVLLGRGDLLLETGELEFHAACVEVVRACKDEGRPLIVGTQLLSSLAHSWLPHRSELAYISSLVEQGVEGFMLATETTIASSPERAISTLAALVSRYGGTPLRPMFAG